MNRREVYKDKLQMDYFSESYIKFEEDFYRYSADNIPLYVLSLMIFYLSMALSHKNYFRLNKQKSVDGRDHYFHFHFTLDSDNKNVRTFRYVGRGTLNS